MELLQQILMLTKFPKVSDTSTNSISALVVHKGNERISLSTHAISKDHLIVDTGAANQMTES